MKLSKICFRFFGLFLFLLPNFCQNCKLLQPIFATPGSLEMVESCGQCQIIVGGHATELYSFSDDAKHERFVFVCPFNGTLRMVGPEWLRKRLKNGPNSVKSKHLICLHNSHQWGNNCCNVSTIKPIPKAQIYKMNYAPRVRPRTHFNITQMGFVANASARKMWPDGDTQWWWYFPLLVPGGHQCLLARLPNSGANISLNLGQGLGKEARPLHTCPLAHTEEQFGCVKPHTFVLRGPGEAPLEIGFHYEIGQKLPSKNAKLMQNYYEKFDNQEVVPIKKPVRILIGHEAVGNWTFVEFGPYCDYSHSFVPIEPWEGQVKYEMAQSPLKEEYARLELGQATTDEKKKITMDYVIMGKEARDQAVVKHEKHWNVQDMADELQQGLAAIISGLKKTKAALNKYKKKAMEWF